MEHVNDFFEALKHQGKQSTPYTQPVQIAASFKPHAHY